jgi:hypothetical protein
MSENIEEVMVSSLRGSVEGGRRGFLKWSKGGAGAEADLNHNSCIDVLTRSYQLRLQYAARASSGGFVVCISEGTPDISGSGGS